MRDNLLKQLPYLKKKFVRNTAYSKASIEQVFSKSELEGAQRLNTEILTSTWFENKGNGEWEAHPLPDEAQIAPIYSILSGNFAIGEKIDLLVGGNDSGFEVETGPVNTSSGYLLQSNGKGGLEAISPSSSGFWIPNETRDMGWINIKKTGQKALLVANNNGKLEMLVWKQILR
jgi:hypothetical protein